MKLSSIITVALMVFGASVSNLEGCTGIQLKQKDGSFVQARTLEFGIDLQIEVVVVPRGYAFKGTTTAGPGIEYKAKYGAVGAICFNNPALMDGINEKGMTVGTFYFPGFAGYTTTTAENQAKSLSPLEFPNWVLTQFETVDEVKAAIGNVTISPLILKEWGPETPPMHWAVFDKSGKGIVIEPVDGVLKVFDNPIGVLTNSPGFEWQLLNLRNYTNLSPTNAKPRVINGHSFAPFGQGSGLVGLPGDFTPPSRFVRATIFSSTVNPVETSEEGIYTAFHLLNQFDIPVGTIRETIKGVVFSDYTMLTAAYDPATLKYYFKTYDDQEIRFVELKKFDLDAKELKRATTTGSPRSVDFSSALKS